MKPSLLPLLAVTVTVLTLTACGGGSDTNPSAAATSPTRVAAATTPVTAQSESQIRRLPGTVQATSRATVAAEIMGSVTTSLEVGQAVAAGEILVHISADELSAAVAQARAALDLATRNHQRESDLLARGASTAETVQNLEDQRRMAAAQLEGSLARLAYTRVAAPFAGTIASRLVETGDLAVPGTPLFTLQGAQLEVQVAVPESLASLPLGDTVLIELGEDRTAPATLTEAAPAADPLTRSRLVRLGLPAATAAIPGQFVRVRWPDQAAIVITVPTTAISSFGQMQRVFVVSDGRAALRLVRTGRTESGNTVILAGLNPGEVIVTEPPVSLQDGQPLNR